MRLREFPVEHTQSLEVVLTVMYLLESQVAQFVVEVQVRQPGMTLQAAHTVLPVSTYPLSHGHAFPDWVRKVLLRQAVQFVDVLAQD